MLLGNWSNTMNILWAQWVLIAWCFRTGASVDAVLSMHPCISSCLRCNWRYYHNLYSTVQTSYNTVSYLHSTYHGYPVGGLNQWWCGSSLHIFATGERWYDWSCLERTRLFLTHWHLVSHRAPTILSMLIQITGCNLLGAKPLPGSILTYCQQNSEEQTLVKFETN